MYSKGLTFSSGSNLGYVDMSNTLVKLTVECFNCPFFIAVPGTPVITSVMNQSSSEVLVTWNITLPSTTGPGASTLYTIYVDDNEGVNTADGTTLTYVIRNLVPYQLVMVQVSASTSAGEGVRSAAKTARSSETCKWQFTVLLSGIRVCIGAAVN